MNCSKIAAVILSFISASAGASCDMTAYKPQAGLTAAAAGDSVVIAWNGERGQELQMRLGIERRQPVIQSLEIRSKNGKWSVLATNVTPEFRVVSGLRRISNQQLAPLRGLGVSLTTEIVSRFRFEPFWDAPLELAPPSGRGGNPPPTEGVADQPGLPRNPSEIRRAAAVYGTTSCSVKTDGARAEVTFPGVELGVFSGSLQFTVFRGPNLIRQEILASTNQPWVAYKYDAGIKGLAIAKGARVAWQDTGTVWRESKLTGQPGEAEPLATTGRVVIAEQAAGSIALLPPPHTFFWAREIAINLGYNWWRKDSATSFSIGIRQAEREHESENPANFSLYSARPGTVQRMTAFLYPNAANAAATYEAALAFTHGDRYRPLEGYQVMNHHYHMDLGQRLVAAGKMDAEIPDLVALKALGINIVSQIDSITGPAGDDAAPVGAVFPGGKPVTAEMAASRAGRGGGRGGDPMAIRRAAIEGAKLHSSPGFLVMPNQEFYGSPLGGHTDLLFSHPVYWQIGRAQGQPLTEVDAKFGKYYHIGSSEDLMAMAQTEDVLINMPHPRTKGSTGFPDAIKDLPFFSDPHYQGVGFRWGMGLDRSEVRLCEYRCQPLFDDMNNWVADKQIPLKYMLSISEVRHQQPGDEIYSSSPVTYVKLGRLPPPDNLAPVVQALMRGDSFVTSGEVLIPSFGLTGAGAQRTVVAEVEWTFPLDFVEVISGDGLRTDRQVIATKDLAPEGKKRFEVPFQAVGKKWVRFAAWDCAGNGAMSQPLRLR